MALVSKAKKWHYLAPRTSARAITLDEYKEQEKWDVRIREVKADKEREAGKYVPDDAWLDWHLARMS